MVGDRLHMAVRVARQQRAGHVAVKAHPAERADLGVHDLAHERMGKLDPRLAGGGGREQPRRDELVERGLRGVGVEAGRVLEHCELDVLADRRGDGEQRAEPLRRGARSVR